MEGWDGGYDSPVVWESKDEQHCEERPRAKIVEETGEFYRFVVCRYDHYNNPPGYKDLVDEYSELGVEITLDSLTQMLIYKGPKEYAIPFVCECYDTADRVEAESIIMDLNDVESLDDLLV